MSRVPDTPCARCGKLLYGGKGALPPGQRTCRTCRSANTEKKPRRTAICSTSGCGSLARVAGSCDKHRNTPPKRLCKVSTCQRAHDSRGWCKAHYKQWARTQGMIKDTWNDTRRNRYHQRRTNKPRRGDPVILNKLIERDGTTCSWCDKPIDMTLTWPNPMYRTIDHIIPVSLGGEHTLHNTRLMHHACNASRGNRIDAAPPHRVTPKAA